jgi:prolyl oligopeptidase
MKHLPLTSFVIAVLLSACGSPEDSTGPVATQETVTTSVASPEPASEDDPYIWLEEVDGSAALAWAREQNALSIPRLRGDDRYEPIRAEIEAVLTSDERIPAPNLIDGQVYNFWQDDEHVRGILRRTSLSSYARENPQWETVLDVDSLATLENANWVYKGMTCLPGNIEHCLMRLSDGGKDAVVMREFSLASKNFVDGGFYVAEAKTNADWFDANTLVVGTDFGEGSLTTSGYARTLRLWRRGTPLESAEQIIEVENEDMGVGVNTESDNGGNLSLVTRRPDFYTEQHWLLTSEGALAELPLPIDVNVQGILDNQVIALLRTDWSPEGVETFAGGSLIAMNLTESVRSGTPSGVITLLDPAQSNDLDAISGVSITSESIYVSALKDVSGLLMRLHKQNNEWLTTSIDLPESGAIRVATADNYNDTVIVNYQSFLTPSTLYVIEGDAEPVEIRSLTPQFDASPYITEQHFVASADGVRIPYFVVRAEDTPMDGSTATKLTAYGGFEVSRTPAYMRAADQAWLARGGAYVLANIRGGGEYGPQWHQTALLENRQRVFDDFIAVAEDLIDRGLTSPDHLGITGGSNGGLLVAGAMVQRPDLFEAVISAVPLIDMLRYHLLLAGASWMAEYGNPDIPEHREFISGYSPYQLVRADVNYPEIFLWTNPKDDRVHPGHARKMAARMLEQGHDIIYFENAEGGHGGGANLNQLAQTNAMEVVYLMQQLMND